MGLHFFVKAAMLFFLPPGPKSIQKPLRSN
jgi:hypothetical protein